MWKLQGGSYIPGFSGQAYGAGLQRDVTKTRKDQAKKAAKLKKYMSKRGAMGKWGGRIASGLLGAALGSTLGPVGLMLAKSAGAGLGSRFGSSKFLSGKGPDVGAGSDGTGLLGSGYEQLGEAKGGIDEAMRGQALGAGAAQLMSGLSGAAGDKLGEAFKQTRAGVRMGELKSGYGKMMAEKFGKNIGQALPEAEQITDLTGTGLGRDFDFGDMPGQLTEDLSWFDKAPGFYGVQQGGYMQGYQEGGPTDMEMMRHTENLRKKYGLEKPEVSDWQQSASEKKYGALKSSEESERESSRLKALAELGGMEHAESARGAEDIYQQSLGDMDRGNLKSLLGLVQGATGTQESRIAKGRSYDLSPYNIGGSVQQQPMAYQLGGLLKYKRSPMMG